VVYLHLKKRKLHSRKKIFLNPYFLVPFVGWLVVGALLQWQYTKGYLFAVVNVHHTDLADTFFYYATWMGQGEVIIPALFGMMVYPAFRNKRYFILAFFCNMVPFGIQQALKSYFDHPRPRLYFNNGAWMHYLPHWPELYTRSFPSGHSAGAFAFFSFLSLVLPMKHRWVGMLFFVLAITVGYSRMYLAAHFFEDVYLGSIVGTVAAFASYYFVHVYWSKRSSSRGLQPE